MAADKNLIRLLVKGDPNAFHKACRDLEEDALSLAGSTFKTLQIVGFDLSNFDLSNTEWENCNFSASKLGEANLTGAYFNGCAFIDCELDEANLDGCALDGCVIRDTSFTNANLSNTEMENNQLQDCALDQVQLQDIFWTRVSFKGGTISQVTEATGEATGLDLRDVILSHVDLDAVSVSRSFHYGCTFDHTELPKGFARKSGRRRSV
ncbi:MAG: pentapeptide repeat-containing protein [Myxococcota bacterium]